MIQREINRIPTFPIHTSGLEVVIQESEMAQQIFFLTQNTEHVTDLTLSSVTVKWLFSGT